MSAATWPLGAEPRTCPTCGLVWPREDDDPRHRQVREPPQARPVTIPAHRTNREDSNVSETADSRWAELAALEPGWDSYGGNPPTEKALRYARVFLNALTVLSGAAEPPIIPTTDGGIAFEWFEGDSSIDASLLIEFGPDGDLSAYARVGRDEIETSET